MSWSGFKKNVNRATTQVMMKTGHVEKTSDREYEVEERRYRTLESASLRLQKEAKGYLDSLRAMTASQMRIAETIDAFYGDSGARDGVSRSYKQAVEDLDAETVKALDGPYRCVPPEFFRWAVDANGEMDQSTVSEIEAELNWRAGKSRVYTRGIIGARDCSGFDRAIELMEYVCRTTVLEPINRFCAYFPDVNECIKKRNHKMLDYDSMRSKVKRLTEKPDKDPGKLPRTEKETEMVHRPSLLLQQFPVQHSSIISSSSMSLQEALATHPDESRSTMMLRRPEVMALRRSERSVHTGLASIMRKSTNTEKEEKLPQRCISTPSSHPTVSNTGQDDSTTEASCSISPPYVSLSAARAVSMPATYPVVASPEPKSVSSPVKQGPLPLCRSVSIVNTLGKAKKHLPHANHIHSSSRKPTPFFNPSELEDIMAPLRAEFLRKEANAIFQAKAVYEQLNEQLTNELPQLIDLRVPYLDPSFEALVKIQLRFCAEAYSRMAQVQQYLDASTRDQYANGDLDARVEEVLGEIRNLSIAGTI